jgi:hypothetical protein
MKTRSLGTKGLSMSQAQSISNLCNQRAVAIKDRLASSNNCSKTVKVDKTDYVTQEAVILPVNTPDLLVEVGQLYSCQAFLMEAIKSKEKEMTNLRTEMFYYPIDAPQREILEEPDTWPLVEEQWGWDQLSDAEYSEYLEVEAYASHIGQFIHKKGKLTELREELVRMPSIEWMTIKDGEKTPVIISKHHDKDKLDMMHEELSAKHREYEQRVNYYKAKVKNLVSDENARIQKENATIWNDFNSIQGAINAEHETNFKAWLNNRNQWLAEKEAEREQAIKDTAQLRIVVDGRFQSVIDMFMKKED